MKSANLTHKPKHAFWALVLLAAILALLFWKCFLPNYVLFSNDGPLGQQNATWLRLPAAFAGCWVDLNDIGSSGGTVTPSVSILIHWLLGPVDYSKFLAPIAQLILGLGAWVFFRQLRFSSLASMLGALAAALVSTFFSDACWGTAPHQIAFGMDFFALALIVSNSAMTSWYIRWMRLALAGFAVGINVIEAADIGAIFSLFIAGFALFHSLSEHGMAIKKIGRGIGRIAIIAVFAGFIAAQTIVSLIGTQIKGIVGLQPNSETSAQHWDWATQWSIPKIETLGIFVPGLFGYRMDTPDGGNYWGAVGRDPAWDRYFASGETGPAPDPQMHFLRFCGSGNYAGVLVLLIALWAVGQSWRGHNSIFSEVHRRLIWFWTAVLVVSLLLAYGRFAPFYRLIYALPYFSTIRNPMKFLFVFTWAIVVIFGYGVHGLSRRYLEIPATGSASPFSQFRAWRASARGFDRNWVSICIIVFIGSLLGWLIYALQRPNLVTYLQKVGFSDEQGASQIASFSIHQVGWFILFFAVDAALLAMIFSGAFSGRGARLGGVLLGLLLVVDLGRADLPWIVFWNYPEKYASNPIVNALKDKPYEHRVAVLHSKTTFEGLYEIEWSQQLFTYYNIQSLDIIQMSRLPEDLAAYQTALARMGPLGMARRWELTNTRYLLGPAEFLDALNQELDPIQRRFRIAQRFNVAPKPGVESATQYSQLTAVPAENGDYALFDFAGALPRAKLYSNWQVDTNDNATLEELTSTNFHPWETVLVSAPLPTAPSSTPADENQNTVEFKSYTPAKIWFTANAHTSSVLLFNDKYDPNWRVFVDGKSAPLLRCNFIMRGVYLTPGEHAVEFEFAPPLGSFYVTLSAIGVGLLLCGFLFASTKRTSSA